MNTHCLEWTSAKTKIIALDADEKKLLEILSDAKKAFIVVTIIGGQGYIFGRAINR